MHLVQRDVEKYIDKVLYHHFENTLTVVCCIVCNNGFSVIGESHCVDQAEFNLQSGKQYAYQNAVNKLIEHVAFIKKIAVFTK